MKRSPLIVLLVGATAMLAACAPTTPAGLDLPTLYNGSLSGRLDSAAATGGCPALHSTLGASADVQAEKQASGAALAEMTATVALSFCRPDQPVAGTEATGSMTFTCCSSTAGTDDTSRFTGPVTVTYRGADRLTADLTIHGGDGHYTGATGTCVVDVQLAATGPVEPQPAASRNVGGAIACRVGDADNAPPPPSFHLRTDALPDADRGQAYRAELLAEGGTPPYRWRATGLPAGLALDGGTITGTATTPGEAMVQVSVDDAAGLSRSATYRVFVHDAELTGSIRSLTGGHPQRWGSMNPSVSDDGEVVSFSSDAANLAGPASDGFVHNVFTWNRSTGVTHRITSGDRDSSLGSRVSGDGSTVVFSSDATNLTEGDTNEAVDVFVADAEGGPITAVTQGDDWSSNASISDDGRTVVFGSLATDLVAGDTNGVADVFSWDRTTGRTTRLTDGNGHSWGADVSDDGNRLSFLSDASDLVAGDTNGVADLFVLDRTSGVTTRIPVDGGQFWGASISGDGGTVAFASGTTAHVAAGTADTNLELDLFRWDAATGQVQRLTNGDAPTNTAPTLSDDGRLIAFNSKATNLASGDLDVDTNDDLFLWDAGSDRISRLTRSGVSNLADTMYPVVSGDGRTVAFASQADDLDPALSGAESYGTWNVHLWTRG